MSLLLLVLFSTQAFAVQSIQLTAGFITKVVCEGRLLVSSVGNDTLVRLEALPKELGCAVLLKPLATSGRTNLILETSSGSVQRLIEIKPLAGHVVARQFEIETKAGAP